MREQILSPKLKKAQVHYITQFTSKKSLKKGIVGLIVGLGLLGTTQLAQADTVKVKSGDTLSQIAQVHHDTVAHLEKVNQLKDVAIIFPGDTLVTGKTNPKKAKVTDPLEPVTTHLESFNKPQAQSHYEAPKQAQVSSQSVTQVPQQSAPVKQATPAPQPQAQPQDTQVQSNSAKEQFLQAGGTEEMWDNIVVPESGGNPNVTSSNGYQGLGQTKESWGTGSVANQTRGMIHYANQRYGSISNAISYHQSNGWW